MSTVRWFAQQWPTIVPPTSYPETSGINLIDSWPSHLKRGVGERCGCPRSGNPYADCYPGLTCRPSPLDGYGAGRCVLLRKDLQ